MQQDCNKDVDESAIPGEFTTEIKNDPKKSPEEVEEKVSENAPRVEKSREENKAEKNIEKKTKTFIDPAFTLYGISERMTESETQLASACSGLAISSKKEIHEKNWKFYAVRINGGLKASVFEKGAEIWVEEHKDTEAQYRPVMSNYKKTKESIEAMVKAAEDAKNSYENPYDKEMREYNEQHGSA